jgi:hypothetical protein
MRWGPSITATPTVRSSRHRLPRVLRPSSYLLCARVVWFAAIVESTSC